MGSCPERLTSESTQQALAATTQAAPRTWGRPLWLGGPQGINSALQKDNSLSLTR